MTQVDAARRALEDAFAKTPDIEPRFVSVGTGADGTLLFSPLAEALKDVAPDRIGAAILVTDGLVHDIPAKAEALGFKAPLHALITGHDGERDRRIELVEAPRFGVVGKDQILRVRVVDSGGGFDPAITISARRDGEAIATLPRAVRAKSSRSPCGSNMADPMSSNWRRPSRRANSPTSTTRRWW